MGERHVSTTKSGGRGGKQQFFFGLLYSLPRYVNTESLADFARTCPVGRIPSRRIWLAERC